MAENIENVLGEELAGPAGRQLAARGMRTGKRRASEANKMREIGAGFYKAGKKMGRFGKVFEQGGRAMNRLGNVQEGLDEGKSVDTMMPSFQNSIDYINRQKTGEVGEEKKEKPNTETVEKSEDSIIEDEEESKQSRLQKLKNKAREKIKKKVEDKVTMPARVATSQLLRWSWFTLIPSWGLTLVLINLHVFLGKVLGNQFFCKLGNEWIPKEVQELGGEAGEVAGKIIGTVEVMLLLFLDLLALFIIGAVLAFIVMIVNFMGASFWQKLAITWNAFMDLGWTGIKALIDLF